MNYAKLILQTELKSLKRREFPWLIKKFGGDKAQLQRIKDVEDALLILNGEIRVSRESNKPDAFENFYSTRPRR